MPRGVYEPGGRAFDDRVLTWAVGRIGFIRSDASVAFNPENHG